MSNSQQLYHTTLRRLEAATPKRARSTQRRNLALIVTALYLAASCHLTRLADHLVIAGHKDSRVQRLRRFLMNDQVAVRDWYGPSVRDILTCWGEARIILVFDRTTLEERLNLLTLSVAYHGRTLPLAWKVLKRQGQLKRCHLEALLRYVYQWAPPHTQIWVVGDREFQDVALQDMIEHELGWHYVQRITNNVWLFPRRGQPFQPRQLNLRAGQSYGVPNVQITRQQAGPAHFIAYWARGEDEPWYLLSDQPTGRATLHIYDCRSWVEPMYRDFKSYGWNLEASRITDPHRFTRLLLGMALAYVWLIQLASHIVKRGWRHWVDRTARRTLSYFRIGGNWLFRQLEHNLLVILPATLYVSAK